MRDCRRLARAAAYGYARARTRAAPAAPPLTPPFFCAVILLRSIWDRTPLSVDLVSAVHVADASYYADLQSRLASYDRVLYELVADKSKMQPDATRWQPPPPEARRRRGRGLVGAIQRFVAAALQLTFQLEQLDYCARPEKTHTYTHTRVVHACSGCVVR
jgi:hypothetical protein